VTVTEAIKKDWKKCAPHSNRSQYIVELLSRSNQKRLKVKHLYSHMARCKHVQHSFRSNQKRLKVEEFRQLRQMGTAIIKQLQKQSKKTERLSR